MAGNSIAEIIMRKSKMVLATMAGWAIFTASLPAQTAYVYPTVPATVLETLESGTGQVVVRGTAQVGSVTAGATVISVTCQQDTLVSSNQAAYGIALDIKVSGQPDDRSVIDYDELDSLRSASDYMGRMDSSVSSLATFEAMYTTKSGLRITGFSSRRAGQIEFGLRSSRMPKGIALSAEQFALLRSILDQAKSKLDALRQR